MLRPPKSDWAGINKHGIGQWSCMVRSIHTTINATPYNLNRPKTKPDEPTNLSKICVHWSATTAPHQFSWNVCMYIIASKNPLRKSIADRAISSRGVISKSSVNRRLISAQPLECHRDNTLGKHFSPAGVPLFSHYHISYLSSLVVLVYPDGGGAWRSSDSRVVVCFSWFVSSCETESQHQTKRQFHSRLCEPGAKFNTYLLEGASKFQLFPRLTCYGKVLLTKQQNEQNRHNLGNDLIKKSPQTAPISSQRDTQFKLKKSWITKLWTNETASAAVCCNRTSIFYTLH